MTVAILGAACRLPQADTPDEFWTLLANGRDLVTEVPPERWDVSAWYDATGRPGTTSSRWGAFLLDPWRFDAPAFGMHPREAAVADPQQRLLLTCTREALDASLDEGQWRGRRVGVFIGATYGMHAERIVARERAALRVPAKALVGNMNNILAARIAHALDLTGPALTVDTACSSALVALHLARRALQAGDCDIALVGAASLLLSPTLHLLMGRAGALSPTGRCRPFSPDADGIVLGEGVGVLVLAPFASARAAGWPMLGLVRGTAVNSDGQGLNLMAPRPSGQAEAMAAAWRECGLDPATASLIEAHGTGTTVGDPVEAAAIAQVFPRGRRFLGSVKGNVGHLLGASGIPSLLKVLWSFRHGAVPATLHCPSPRADLDFGGAEIPSQLAPWDASFPRRAGVNSFGFGGSNAHVVLEEPPADATRPRSVRPMRGRTHVVAPPAAASERVRVHPLLRRLSTMRLGRAELEAEASKKHWLLAQHTVTGRPVLPAAALWDVMMVAAQETLGRPVAGLADVVHVRRAGSGTLRVSLSIETDGVRVALSSARGPIARGRIVESLQEPELPTIEPARVKARCAHTVEPADMYAALAGAGLVHGPRFRLVETLQVGDGEALARLAVPEPLAGVRFHPALIDAAMQPITAWLMVNAKSIGLCVPWTVGEIRVGEARAAAAYSWVHGLTERDGTVHGQILVTDEAGAPVLEIRDLTLLPVRRHVESGWFHRVSWERSAADPAEGWPGTIFEVPSSRPKDAVLAVHRALHAAPGPIRFIVRRAVAIRPDDPPPEPAAAAAAAYAIAAAAEEAGRDCAVVDLPSDAPAGLVRRPFAAPFVAWRNDAWWVRTLVPVAAPPLRDLPSGPWILIGGATGITYEVARALAAPGRTLVLVGRTPIDATREARVAELRAAGAVVEYLAADVRDAGGMLDRVRARFGVPAGIVHGAGEVKPRRHHERSADDIEETLAGKAGGALALAAALLEAGEDPIVLLLSSVSAVVPESLGAGLADYAAANAALDALASSQRARGARWVSLGYSAWCETGLAAGSGILERLAERGWVGLASAPAARAALRALTSEDAHLIVAHRRPKAAAARVDARPSPDTDLEGLLRALLARAMKLEPSEIPLDTPFTRLGLDSLDAVELVHEMEDHGLGSIPESIFFEQRTLRDLVRVLQARRPSPQSDASVTPSLSSPDSPSTATLPSPLQRAFLLQAALFSDVTPFAYVRQTVDGPIDIERLTAALGRLVSDHAALRLGFERASPDACLVTPPPRTMEVHDYAVRDDGALARLEDALANSPFDLGEPPLLRAARIRHGERTHLVLVAHHAVVDGWSLFVLATRLRAYYDDLAAVLPPEPVPAAVALVHPPASKAGGTDAPAPWPTLPGWRPGPPTGPRTAALRWLDAPTSAALERRLSEWGVTLFAVAAASWARVLGCWVGADTVTLNVAIGRRTVPDAVGCFADTVPLTLPTPGSLDETVAALNTRWPEAQHAAGNAVTLTGPAPDGGPSMPSPFGLSVAAFRPPARAGLELTEVCARTATAATRLGLTVWTAGGRLGLAVNAPRDRIAPEALQELADRMASALAEAAESETQPFWRDVLDRAIEMPDAVAVRLGHGSYTYRELDQASARLAAGLAARGIGAGHSVGVVTDASPEAVAVLLGVARAGAAWLPIDPDHPAPRVARQIALARPALLLHTGDSTLESEHWHSVAADGRPPDVRPGPDDLAYIIFTSGSKGEPKGVPISRRSIDHYLRWSLGMLGIGPGDRLLQTATLVFDASVRQVFAPLMAGAATHVVPTADARDPGRLWSRLRDEEITHLNTTPSQLARLLAEAERRPGEALPSLRHITVGGEALPAALVRRWRARFGDGHTLVNLYGPTEVTINATYHVVGPEEDPVPIGRPLPGHHAFILDAAGHEVEEGELCIAGVGVFSGYLGNEPAPFVAAPDGSRAYRTGDRVRRRADGALLYLGRLDDQVKVRGVRIEPGDIEACLASHPSVRLAFVVRAGSGDDARLVAWIEADIQGFDAEALRDHVRAHLPASMVPSEIHRCDALPLGPTGKVDRNALAAEPVSPRTARGGPPVDDVERRIAAVWSEVLGVAPLGRADDFFALGGDSLAAVRATLAAQASGAALLYEHPTLQSYAAALAVESSSMRTENRATPDDAESFPLSSVQLGFLRMEALDPSRPAVWRGRFPLKGALDVDALRQAWALLFRRHPMLRATFPAERPPRQRILCAIPTELPLLDDDVKTEPESFDLTRAPLVRGGLRRVPGGHVLEVEAHHIVGDAWSGALLLGELCAAHDALVAGREPPWTRLTTTFRDVVAHLAAQAPEPASLAWWRDVWRAPYAEPGPIETAPGLIVQRERRIGGADAARLLGALYVALREATGQDDLVIGVARSGRDLPLPGIEHVVGPLAVALPVRVRPRPGERAFASARAALHDTLRHALPPDRIRAALPSGVPMPGGRHFLSVLDVPRPAAGPGLTVDWDSARTMMDLPSGTRLQVTARPSAGAMQLAFTADSSLMDRAALESLADAMVGVLEDEARESRPTASRAPAVRSAALDAALIAYAPPRRVVARQLGVDPEALLGAAPRWLGVAETPLGRLGMFCLPHFADALGASAAEVAAAVREACARGARAVALAGVLPSRTAYGHDVLAELAPHDGARVTTGHAATAVAVARTALEALAVMGRTDVGCVALLGVGSVGRVALELLLESTAPHEILLCDLPSRRAATEAVAARLPGRVRVVDALPAAPPGVLAADLIIGASTGAVSLDVNGLRPGTLVIDDSFPPCVDLEAAQARMETRRDVLVVGGGLLGLPGMTFIADPALAGMAPGLVAMLPSAGLPGCAVEALLRAADPRLPPTLGVLTLAQARRAWAAVEDAAATIPPLHLGRWTIPEAVIAALPRRA